MRGVLLLLGVVGCGSSGVANHPSNTAAGGGACLPSEGAVELARVGGDLVACTSEEPARCWTVDRASGALAPRSQTAAFGFAHVVLREKLQKPGCYQDLCWTPP